MITKRTHAKRRLKWKIQWFLLQFHMVILSWRFIHLPRFVHPVSEVRDISQHRDWQLIKLIITYLKDDYIWIYIIITLVDMYSAVTEFTLNTQSMLNKKATNVDKLNEILTSKTDFRFVHSVDGHLQPFVQSHIAIGRSNLNRFFRWQHREVCRTFGELHVSQQWPLTTYS